MKRLAAYPKYKPSGVDWLGDIPEHWDIKKIKWVYRSIHSGDGISPENINEHGLYPIYGGNGIMGYTENFNSNCEDIIIGRVGAKCGNVYLADGGKWISDNALKLDPSKTLNKKFLAVFLIFRNLNLLANQNAQPLITGTIVSNQVISFPPLLEQQTIADFLDRETGKIDGLIEKREKLITLLREKRSALISHAVTKGLNPDVKLKPSGVDWLGDIPEHWGIKKLKHCFTIQNGSTPSTSDENNWEGNIIWVTPADISKISSKYIDGSSKLITETGFKSCALTLLEPDGIIVSTRAPIGSIAIAAKKLCHNQGCKSLPKSKIVNSIFAYYYIRSIVNILNIRGKGTTFLELNTTDFGAIEIPFLPLSEQQEIADYLNRETAKIDSLIAKEQQIIEKMREYRTALISAAVTGKIDVRGELKP